MVIQILHGQVVWSWCWSSFHLGGKSKIYFRKGHLQYCSICQISERCGEAMLGCHKEQGSKQLHEVRQTILTRPGRLA